MIVIANSDRYPFPHQVQVLPGYSFAHQPIRQNLLVYSAFTAERFKSLLCDPGNLFTTIWTFDGFACH
jgi:hypothetical protein